MDSVSFDTTQSTVKILTLAAIFYKYSHLQAVVTNGLGLIFDPHGNYFGEAIPRH
jgi:hypothetical protein